MCSIFRKTITMEAELRNVNLQEPCLQGYDSRVLFQHPVLVAKYWATRVSKISANTYPNSKLSYCTTNIFTYTLPPQFVIIPNCSHTDLYSHSTRINNMELNIFHQHVSKRCMVLPDPESDYNICIYISHVSYTIIYSITCNISYVTYSTWYII